VNLLIENAIAARPRTSTSSPLRTRSRVRYRWTASCSTGGAATASAGRGTSRIKLMAEMNIAERRLPQDGRIRVTVPAGGWTSASPRSRPCTASRSSCGCSTARACSWRSRSSASRRARSGGSSRSSSARTASCSSLADGLRQDDNALRGARQINSPDRKIITVEDPVEYQLKGVNQIPVKPKIGLHVATGLRHIVRQDPDVILIGEIRDLETAEIAIQARSRGHLVFSTLHTNDAPGAITRLQDMGVEAYLVASVLEGVLAQRLVRRICHRLPRPDTPSAADLEALGIEGAGDQRLLPRRRLRRVPRGPATAAHRHLRVVPITERRAASSYGRAPTRDIRRHAIEGAWSLSGWRLAQGRRGRDDRRGNPPAAATPERARRA